jgi:hypothetical protein
VRAASTAAWPRGSCIRLVASNKDATYHIKQVSVKQGPVPSEAAYAKVLTYTTTGWFYQMQTQQAAAYQALRCSQRDWKQGDEATASKRSHAGQLASRSRSQVCRELPRHLS